MPSINTRQVLPQSSGACCMTSVPAGDANACIKLRWQPAELLLASPRRDRLLNPSAALELMQHGRGVRHEHSCRRFTIIAVSYLESNVISSDVSVHLLAGMATGTRVLECCLSACRAMGARHRLLHRMHSLLAAAL